MIDTKNFPISDRGEPRLLRRDHIKSYAFSQEGSGKVVNKNYTFPRKSTRVNRIDSSWYDNCNTVNQMLLDMNDPQYLYLVASHTQLLIDETFNYTLIDDHYIGNNYPHDYDNPVCTTLHRALTAIGNPSSGHDVCGGDFSIKTLYPTIFDRHPEILCQLHAIPVEDLTLQKSCIGEVCESTQSNWDNYATDQNIHTFIAGGLDEFGVPWIGLDWTDSRDFSDAIGHQMLALDNYECNLESPCNYPLDCSKIGNWLILGLGQQVLRLPWVGLMVESLQIEFPAVQLIQLYCKSHYRYNTRYLLHE